MTITNGYATLAQFKERYDVEGTDNNRDAEMEAVIQSVSREIDLYCCRVFYAGSAGVVRYFEPVSPGMCPIDDAITITAVKTDADGDGVYETTWASTDYYSMPMNGSPIMWLQRSRQGSYSFPVYPMAVQVTGTWGYASTTPDVVREACLIQSHRIWVRKAAPFGVAGASEMGNAIVIAKIDPDMQLMLDPLRRTF